MMEHCLASLFPMEMKILVTGGAGFLGSHIVDLLISKGVETYVLKSGFRSKKHPSLINKEAIVIEGDLLDYWNLHKATKNMDMVFHCGAVLSHYAEQYPELAFDVNVKGTWNLKRACHENGVTRIIFASTSFVYGNPAKEPVSESDPLNPKGNFEVGKLAAEKILQAVHPFQVPYTILRLFNMYGPRSYPDELYTQATATFILEALKGKSIEVHADGKQELDFVYVKDVAEAFWDCARTESAENEIFNVGSGESKSILQLANTINQLTKNIAGVHFNTKHPPYFQKVRANIEHIKECVGWTPKTEWITGLQETIDFFKEWKH